MTDTLKKALTYLGAAHEIYLGKFEDDAHVGTEPMTPEAVTAKALDLIKKAKTFTKIQEIIDRARKRDINAFQMSQLQKAQHERQVLLNGADTTQQMDDLFDGNDEDKTEDTTEEA
jgi:hypothetical protein